jgi:hypothetical protein
MSIIGILCDLPSVIMPPALPCAMGISDESGELLSLAAQLDVDIRTAIAAVLNNLILFIYLSSILMPSKTKRRCFKILCQGVVTMKISCVSNLEGLKIQF